MNEPTHQPAAPAQTTASEADSGHDEVSRKLDAASRTSKAAALHASTSAAAFPSAIGDPNRRRRAVDVGVGAMGPRSGRDDEPAPPPEMMDEARNAARASGHRFDLMRYLRLRRKQ